MRILYLVNAQQSSFQSFVESGKTNFPWVDAMLTELAKDENIIIGLAVPIINGTYQISQNNTITYYGLPSHVSPRNINRIFEKKLRKGSDENVNTYAYEAIKDFVPDLIQIFGTENIFGLLLTKTNRPMVIHFQGSVQVVSTKWFSGISKFDQFRYSSIKDIILNQGTYYEYFKFKKRAIREELIIKNCRYFIGRTSFDKRFISFISPKSKYFHCEEFIREAFFEKQWSTTLTNRISCISILKGVTYKGIDMLIETLGLLLEHSTINIEFKICGVREDEGIVKILKRKYGKKIVFSRIKFLGKLDTNSLINELCASNLFIHPSYMENSSNSICEAMSLGMPVISTNVGGTSSLIQDGLDGLLVQEGEPYSLAAVILELISNYDYAMILGKNAREKSKLRHNPNNLKKQTVEIYQTILAGNSTLD